MIPTLNPQFGLSAVSLMCLCYRTSVDQKLTIFVQPKTISSTASTAPDKAPAPKWDKDAWIAKLNDEQKELLKLEIETLHESWLQHLTNEVTSPEFLNLKRFLKKEVETGKKIFPPSEDVYSW